MNGLHISFGGLESKHDDRTITADMLPQITAAPPETAKIPLDYPSVNDLCDQKKLGICTDCGTRMSAEDYFRDGVRLSEYWGYLIGKVLVDNNLDEGSSAATMLHAAFKYGIPTKTIEQSFLLKTDGTYAEFIEHFKTHYQSTIPQAVLMNATNHKISGYYKLSSLSPFAIAKEISNKKVLIIRMLVGENFYTDKNGRYTNKPSDLFPLRAPKKIESGHILAMNEYKGLDYQQLLSGPNSWSKLWGDNGYYHFVLDTQLPYFTEAWAIADKPITAFRYTFNKDLKKGDRNPDVAALQRILTQDGVYHSAYGITGFYGDDTASAVLAYQRKYHVAPEAEIAPLAGTSCGPKTRADLNTRYGA